MKLAILQRVIPSYRTALFKALSNDPFIEVRIFIGEDIPNSKVKSTTNLEGISVKKLRTRFLKLGRRVWPWHFGLIDELKAYQPDCVLCEGESHFLGYLQAIFYKIFINRKVALIHWCFISLPGEPLDRGGILGWIKAYFRTHFNAFLLYSSFSKERLVQLGIPSVKAFVATNVGDVKKFVDMANSLELTPKQAREKIGLPDKFTVLYSGTLDENKRPQLIIELAQVMDPARFNFLMVGSGDLLVPLRNDIKDRNITNVFLPGRISDGLSIYYRASDLMIIPGRGGIVMSEAMAFGIPIVVHQADGTEYDLVRNGETGFILEDDSLDSFIRIIEYVYQSPEKRIEMGMRSKSLAENRYTTQNMVIEIKKACEFAVTKS